jgi:hypothetical protein
MLVHTRWFLVVAIVCSPVIAAAQVVDPWAEAAPASASTPAPTAEPASATEHEEASEPAPAMQVVDPWAQPPRPRRPPPYKLWPGHDRADAPRTLIMRSVLPGPATTFGGPLDNKDPALDAMGPVEPSGPPPRRYPFELVDRPLVLPPGVTELGVAYERRSFVATTPREYGSVMTERATVSTPDLSLAHAFSRAEIGIGIGQRVYGWVAVDRQSFPKLVQLSAGFSAPQSDGRYAHTQSLTAEHKLWVEESRAALIGIANLSVAEVSGYNPTGLRVSGAMLVTAGDLILRVQVVSRFALSFGAGSALPLAQSAKLDARAVIGGSSSMLIAFHSWDIIASGSVANVTDDMATCLGVGIRKRWGL